MAIWTNIKIEQFKDKVFDKVTVSKCKDAILFQEVTGERYLMYHDQDCCEDVFIESIDGDLQSLVGNQIVLAEQVNSVDRKGLSDWTDSYTWTYYKLATCKGYITIRWYGESNGYYSENVDLIKVDDKESELVVNGYFSDNGK